MFNELELLVIELFRRIYTAKLQYDSDRKFVNDQCAVLMTLDTINVNEFLKYFKNNLDKLHLPNNEQTKVAILVFHGSPRGVAGRMHRQYCT